MLQDFDGNPSNPLPLLAHAWDQRRSARWGRALELCRQVLSKMPECGEAWHLLGVLHRDRGDLQKAAMYLKQAISVEPGQPEHYNNLGVVLNDLHQHRDASSLLEKALDLCPEYMDAKCNLGLSLFHQHHLEQAAQIFDQVTSQQPSNAAAHANLGLVYLTQHRYGEAVVAYQKAVAINATASQWHLNLGAAHAGLGDYKQAASCFRNAISLSPDNLDLHLNLGISLRYVGRYSEAINAFKAALALKPGHSETICNLIIAYEQTCHWNELPALYRQLDRDTRQALLEGELPSEDPMLNIRRCDDPAFNRAVAQAWSQSALCEALRLAKPYNHQRMQSSEDVITVGYLSHDFRDHPVAHQLYPLFRLHDRKQFKIVVFSLGPDDGSSYRKEIETQCDQFFDLSRTGLAQAAQIIYEQQIDILVDLMGHSKHNRMGLLALRPAPLQISFLGFLSTTGADFIDYLVVDDVVVPPEQHAFLSEKPLRLPHCYQMNHGFEIIDNTDIRREAFNLKSDDFVFCCFNVTYKIDRSLFDTWMRILHQTPNSILWLFSSNAEAVANMRARAQEKGIHPDRLVFAEKLPLADHLRRLSLADLALDTLRYNGGATTANALATSLPVLTVLGNHWVSRMAAGHLMAAGLSELVVHDLAAYEQKAVEMARNPKRLGDLRENLRQNRKTLPLFDASRFVGYLEAGFKAAWERYCGGELPCSIRISNCETPDPTGRTDNRIYHESSNAARLSKTLSYGDGGSEALSDFSSAPMGALATNGKLSQRIYIFCPDTHLCSAGIRRLYRHVSLLTNAGFQTFMVHEQDGFQRRDMPAVPLKYISQIGPEADAVLVIPEGMPTVMHRFKDHPARRFVIALNWHYIFGGLPDRMDWRHFNIERVLVVSPVIGQMVSWAMGLPVHLLSSSIDHDRYRYDPAVKQPQVSFIQRKAVNIDRLKRLLGARNTDFINKIKWIGLDGISEENYANEICTSSIFLNTSMAEGLPTSTLEAMAAGTIVAGYDSVGGRTMLAGNGASQNCILAPNGDYVSLAYALEPVLTDLVQGQMKNWAPIIANARHTASQLTLENERESLISFWKKVCSPV